MLQFTSFGREHFKKKKHINVNFAGQTKTSQMKKELLRKAFNSKKFKNDGKRRATNSIILSFSFDDSFP